MPDPSVLRREAPITGHDAATRTITVQLLRWDDPRTVVDPGRRPYRERWARDSLVPLDRLYVLDQHHGDLIGRMSNYDPAGPGPTADLTVARTRAGNDLLELVDAGVIDGVSVEALADPTGEVWSPDRQEVTRTRGLLAGVAFGFHPAHDSPILARTGGAAMPETTTDQAGATAGAGTVDLEAVLRSLEAPAGPAGNGATAGQPTTDPPVGAGPTAPAGGAGTVADRLARAIDVRAAGGQDAMHADMAVLREGMIGLIRRGEGAGAAAARYAGFGEVMRANARGDLAGEDMARLNRAIVDVTTADIAGLIPRPALASVVEIITRNQQLADAAASVPLPDSGMTIDYPRIVSRPGVGIQVAQKTDVMSVKTNITRGTADLVTFAGGEDISLQAILRSSPSYLQIVGELYLEAMATATDLEAYRVYNAAITDADHRVAIGTDPKAWVTALFDIAGTVLTDRKALPNRLILSTDLWVKMGGAVDTDGRPIFTNVNPVNPAGSVSLTDTEGNVRGLTFAVDPNLPADVGCMFDAQSFRSALGGIGTLTADVPLKLGRDYAVYRFGTFLPVDPNGMAIFGAVAAPAPDPEARDAEGSGRSRRSSK
jgi:hypothetical protein